MVAGCSSTYKPIRYIAFTTEKSLAECKIRSCLNSRVAPLDSMVHAHSGAVTWLPHKFNQFAGILLPSVTSLC
jgi:hypothetical protein